MSEVPMNSSRADLADVVWFLCCEKYRWIRATEDSIQVKLDWGLDPDVINAPGNPLNGKLVPDDELLHEIRKEFGAKCVFCPGADYFEVVFTDA